MPKKHPIIHHKSLYTKNQIIWGLSSLLLFFGTIAYLNIKGLAQDPQWLAKAIPSPTNIPISPVQSMYTSLPYDLGNGLVYGMGDTMFKYDEDLNMSVPIATYSAQIIHDIGITDTSGVWVLTGKTLNSYDTRYSYSSGKQTIKEFPSVPFYTVKPVLSNDGKYLYWWTIGVGGRRMLMFSDIENGMQQELVQSSIPIVKMAVSPSRKHVVLVAEMLNANQSKTYALGLVASSTKNINLFPSVNVLPDSKMFFNSNGDVLFIDITEGVAAVSLDNGRVLDVIINARLMNQQLLAKNDLLVARQLVDIPTCKKGLIFKTAYQTIHMLRFSSQAFTTIDIAVIQDKLQSANLLITSPIYSFSKADGTYISQVIDPATCSTSLYHFGLNQQEQQLLNIENIDKMPAIIVPYI